MLRNNRYNLTKIIYNDLYKHGKISLFLLLCIMASAICIIILTYQTRCIILNNEKLLLEKELLENEQKNLILKKEILSNHIRIEHIALNKLNMDYVNPISLNIYDQ